MKIPRILSFILVSALLLTPLTACGSKASPQQGTATKSASTTSAENQEPIKLVMWNTFFVGPDDAKMDRKDWYITQAIERFKKQYPNVDVEVTTVPSSVDHITKFKAAGVAKNGPDLATIWSGSYAFSVKQFLLPLDKYISSEDKENITGWWTVKEGLSESGTPTYGYPNNDAGITCIFYNKKLVKKAGLDFDANPPRTIPDFMTVCEKIKQSGVTPMVMTMKDGGMEAFMTPYWFGQMAGGTNKFVELLKGETTFAKEPAFLQADNIQKEMYDKGYINKDVLSTEWGEVDNRMLSGKAAMTIGGTWLISAYSKLGEDLGMMQFPNVSNDAAIKDTGIGGPGILVGVTSYSKYPEMSAKFVQFLESKDEMIKFAQCSLSIIPNRKDIDISKTITNPLLLKQSEWLKKEVVIWLDNVMPGEWTGEWFKLAPLYMTGKLSADEYIKKLDEKLAEAIQK